MKSYTSRNQRKAKIPTDKSELEYIEAARRFRVEQLVKEFVLTVWSKRGITINVRNEEGLLAKSRVQDDQRPLFPLSEVEQSWIGLRKIRRLHYDEKTVHKMLEDAYQILLVRVRMNPGSVPRLKFIGLDYAQIENRILRPQLKPKITFLNSSQINLHERFVHMVEKKADRSCPMCAAANVATGRYNTDAV